MKKSFLLFLFCFVSMTAGFSQKNELNFESILFLKSRILPGGSIAYYRYVTSNMALGLRSTYVTDKVKSDLDDSYWQVEMTTKVKAFTFKKIDFYVEPGVSYLRITEEYSPSFNTFAPITILIQSYLPPYYKKLNYYGFTSGIIMNYSIDDSYGVNLNLRFNYFLALKEEVWNRSFWSAYPSFNFYYLF